jgi:hypothetical protein
MRTASARLCARIRPELVPASLAALLATAAGLIALEIWRANPRVPYYLGGDATFTLAVIKGVVAHGWYLSNPSLGAPFTQHLYDYPVFSGDGLYLLMLKLIAVPFSNPAAIVNVFFLLCFPLIAISAYIALRALGISIGAAILCAVLFTMLPYRFYRGEGHLFQGAYFTVPLGCYLVLAVFARKAFFERDSQHSGIRAYLTWRSGATVLACVIMGASDNYYAAFTTALVVLATLLTFLASRSLRILTSGLAVAGIVLATMILSGLPTLIYESQHGSDPAVGRRLPMESDMYGLTLADLVLPTAGSRIQPLADLTQRYQATAPAPVGEGHSANIGLIATLGLLWLTIAFAVRGLGEKTLRVADRETYAAVGAGLAFLIATVGGLGTIFAYIVSPQLRALNRISIFIAFFAFVGVGSVLDRMGGRFAGSSRGRWAFSIGLIGLLVVGLLDQTSSSMAPPYKTYSSEYFTDARFVAGIEHQLPRDASVFQLPYVPFPENPPVNKMQDYDELIGYLHSAHLRWSYGQLKGLPSDWESAAVTQPFPLMLAEVSAAGFQGIYVDSYGYTDGGAALNHDLQTLLGVVPFVSADGRLYFFNMSHYNQRLREQYPAAVVARLRTAALYPAGGQACQSGRVATPVTERVSPLCAAGPKPQLTP